MTVQGVDSEAGSEPVGASAPAGLPQSGIAFATSDPPPDAAASASAGAQSAMAATLAAPATAAPPSAPANAEFAVPAEGGFEDEACADDMHGPSIDTLREIEKQCISHGRHPAEWDPVALGWVPEDAIAQPYFIVQEPVPKPNRGREVVCELLAAGVPVSADAHNMVNNALSQRSFVRNAKRLLAVARAPAELNMHAVTALEQKCLLPQQFHFIASVCDLRTRGFNAVEALNYTLANMGTVSGSMSVTQLEGWLEAMKTIPYESALREVRKQTKGQAAAPKKGASPTLAAAASPAACAGTPATATAATGTGAVGTAANAALPGTGPHAAPASSAAVLAAGAATQPPAGSRISSGSSAPAGALASVAEKMAQYLAGFYHQEVKQVKARRASGVPPRPLMRQGPADFDHAAPNGAGLAGAPQALIDQVNALLAQMPANVVPPGSVFGFCTPAGAFQALQSASPPPPAAVGSVGADDPELQDLARIYHVALWQPEKARVQEQCLAVYAARHPDATGRDFAKEAIVECTCDVTRMMREEHYGSAEVRDLLRDVALVVTSRIESGQFVPLGSVSKCLDTMANKTGGLSLPARSTAAPPPLERLLRVTPPHRVACSNGNKRARTADG